MKNKLPPLLLVLAFLATPALAQESLAPPLPPLPSVAQDFPNDQGTKVQIGWLPSFDDALTTLPTVVLSPTPEPGAMSAKAHLEQEIERDRHVWYKQLTRPVAEMIAETDPVLSQTFRGYLAGVVRRDLENPLLIATTISEPAAWLQSFAATFEPDDARRAPLLELAGFLGDSERLKSLMESGDDEYVQIQQKLVPLLDELVDPKRILAVLESNQDGVALLQKMMDASDLKENRALFRRLYTTARDYKQARELQEEALEKLQQDDPAFAARVAEARQALRHYELFRAESPDGPWKLIGTKGSGNTEFEDSGDGGWNELETGRTYFYRVDAVGVDGGRSSSAVVSATPETQWWYHGRTNNFFATGIFIALIIGWIWGADKRMPPGGLLAFVFFSLTLGAFAWAGYGTPANVATLGCLLAPAVAFGVAEIGRRAGELYVRPIAGIEAVEEAIGRATEMGKPILFVPGLSTIEDIATLAALNILGPVAEKAAEYDSKIIVPNRDPVVYTIAQEIVKEAYLRAGRPDSFDAGSIYFVTGRQFAYAAAVNGLMVREKPATNFFLGMFWAESLLLAETGNLTGAIQIAGTDAVTQLPFFIVACDYTLIGEELYAAGAYMGRDPKLLGGLKGQDYNKALILLGLGVFAILFFVTDLIGARSAMTDFVSDIFEALFKVKN